MSYAYFTDRLQIKAAGVPVAADVTLEQLQEHIDQAELNILVPNLGQATLDQVQQLVATDDALLKRVRAVLAAYAVASYSPISQRSTTSTGTTALPGQKDNANTDKLNAQHVANQKAFAADCLELLIAHIEQRPLTFVTWHASQYCTLFPNRRYFDGLYQLRNFTAAAFTHREFLAAQPALMALTARRILPTIGPTLHLRLLAELDLPQHQPVLDLLRTALAAYLVQADSGMLQAADCALVELRILLQASLADYPEFMDSPSFVPSDITPTTTAHAFVGMY